MRVMVFLLLGTNQQVITLHSLALPDRLPLELSISGMVWWVSGVQAGCTFPCCALGGRRSIE